MLLILAFLALAIAEPPPPRQPNPPSVDPATLGPAVGQPIPQFEARDQDGRLRNFASLAGPNGLLLVFFRSADW